MNMKHLAPILALTALTATAAVSQTAPEEQKKTVTPIYNALEVGMDQNGNVRTRLWTLDDMALGEKVLGYDAFTETNDVTRADLFGRHAFSFGNGKNRAVAWIKIGGDGIVDRKVGVRNYSINQHLGGYGFFEITSNTKEGNITAFFGKEIGNTSIELFNEFERNFHSGRKNYSEIQLNQNIATHLRLFGRAEYSGNIRNSKYIFGVTVKR